ncbi:hypothetical protein GGR57DRAFT_509120 [Xylariaceae sp. FL1272]|nr:hypothetical protein GGR57DRAFT_509120 [Xylariaceae sp. FL1272]
MAEMGDFSPQMNEDIQTREQRFREEIQNVLDQYRKIETQQLYEEVTRVVREECETVLKNMKKEVKGVVNGRTKDYASLKKKLRDLQAQTDPEDLEKHPKSKEHKYLRKKRTLQNLQANPDRVPKDYEFLVTQVTNLKEELENQPQKVPNFRAWVGWGASVYEHPEMGDLAGVRIGLYLPDHIPTVVKEIDKRFHRRWLFGTVTGGRNITVDRNLDVQKHLNGRWHSEGPDGTVDHWEHYGYRSWQVVVELKEPLCEKLASLRETVKTLHLRSLRVEIQIGTVVTQAWAEVQHNIIYKNPDNIIATRTMKRMIDATNGLAITTDIILTELEKGLGKAGRQHFRDGPEFLSWFQSRYMSRMDDEERQRWKCSEEFATVFIDVLNWIHPEGSRPNLTGWEQRVPKPCRDEFNNLIENRKLLKFKKTSATADITKLLVRTMPIDPKSLAEKVYRERKTHKQDVEQIMTKACSQDPTEETTEQSEQTSERTVHAEPTEVHMEQGEVYTQQTVFHVEQTGVKRKIEALDEVGGEGGEDTQRKKGKWESPIKSPSRTISSEDGDPNMDVVDLMNQQIATQKDTAEDSYRESDSEDDDDGDLVFS